MRPAYRDEPCRTALTRVRNMSFHWSLNPYMGCAHRCTFCFVRAFEALAERPSDGRYGTSIRVKSNLVEVLRRELARRSWRREQVVVGTATDPYQPAEGRFRLTRGAIEALGEARTPIGLITRGPLIVRDIDVLSARRERGRGRCHVLDPDARPRDLAAAPSPEPRRRPSACARCARWSTPGSTRASGWPRSCPGCRTIRRRWPTSSGPRATPARPRSGPTCCTCGPGTREHFLDNLARDWPALLPMYERLYAGRAYVTKDVVEPVRQRVRDLARIHGVADRRRRPIQPSAADLVAGEQLALAL